MQAGLRRSGGGLVWFAFGILLLLWTAFAGLLYAAISLGAGLLGAAADYLPIDPGLLTGLESLLAGLGGVGQVIVGVVWVFGALALLAIAGIVRGFARSVEGAAATVGDVPPPAPPGRGAVYDVTPDNVRQE